MLRRSFNLILRNRPIYYKPQYIQYDQICKIKNIKHNNKTDSLLLKHINHPINNKHCITRIEIFKSLTNSTSQHDIHKGNMRYVKNIIYCLLLICGLILHTLLLFAVYTTIKIL